MAYTQDQQDRLTKAQNALDAARAARNAEWQGSSATNPAGYGVLDLMQQLQKCNGGASIAIDADGNITSVSTGSKGSCSNATFKDRRDKVNAAINVYVGAQQTYLLRKADFDKVVEQVSQEVHNDPNFIHNETQIAADATIAGKRYIFYAVVVIVVAFAIFAYFKWFKKSA